VLHKDNSREGESLQKKRMNLKLRQKLKMKRNEETTWKLKENNLQKINK
jgi:hypothetical protein